MSPESALVIAPHPDDEVLGCGGTIARFVSQGYEVNVIIVTRGVTEIFSSEQIEETRNELKQAHEILGINQTVFLDFPAPKLDTIPIHQIADTIQTQISYFRPRTVFFPHLGDLHTDHKIVHHATMVATRPKNSRDALRLLCYETLSETDWAVPISFEAFMPNFFVDISEYLDCKLRALSCYQSQITNGPLSRTPRIVEALALLRGSTVGVRAAEAFMLMREILL